MSTSVKLLQLCIMAQLQNLGCSNSAALLCYFCVSKKRALGLIQYSNPSSDVSKGSFSFETEEEIFFYFQVFCNEFKFYIHIGVRGRYHVSIMSRACLLVNDVVMPRVRTESQGDKRINKVQISLVNLLMILP